MSDNAPKVGKAVKVFSGTVPKSSMPDINHPNERGQFVECHLQPVPKTFKLYSFEVEDADGNLMPFFAHPTGPLPPFNWVEPADCFRSAQHQARGFPEAAIGAAAAKERFVRKAAFWRKQLEGYLRFSGSGALRRSGAVKRLSVACCAPREGERCG